LVLLFHVGDLSYQTVASPLSAFRNMKDNGIAILHPLFLWTSSDALITF